MKTIYLLLALSPFVTFGQIKNESLKTIPTTNNFIRSTDNLNLEAALELATRVTASAAALNTQVTMAILDASGNTILILRADNVGPHNTEAARRKAYTSLSTKTASLQLLRNAEKNSDSKNLNTLPELLLLSGGSPIWYNGNIIGSIGVAGGGSVENDDLIAKSAEIKEKGITTTK